MAKISAEPAASDAGDKPTTGKGRPTPTRAEQEAARKRPLVGDPREARKRARVEAAAQREKARIGMAAGDERYLMARDKGPQRRFVRDWVDSRWHLAEFVMPLVLLVLLSMFVNVVLIQVYAYVLLWAVVALAIINMAITSIRVKRAARAKFGADRMERGLGWYAAMRTVQMRFLRTPKPQVKRGGRPV